MKNTQNNDDPRGMEIYKQLADIEPDFLKQVIPDYVRTQFMQLLDSIPLSVNKKSMKNLNTDHVYDIIKSQAQWDIYNRTVFAMGIR